MRIATSLLLAVLAIGPAFGSPAPFASAMAVGPRSLDFTIAAGGANPAAQSFTITNGPRSNERISYTVSNIPSWITINPNRIRGTIAAGARQTILVNINSAGLTSNQTATLVISGRDSRGERIANSPSTVTVRLRVVGWAPGFATQAPRGGASGNPTPSGATSTTQNGLTLTQYHSATGIQIREGTTIPGGIRFTAETTITAGLSAIEFNVMPTFLPFVTFDTFPKVPITVTGSQGSLFRASFDLLLQPPIQAGSYRWRARKVYGSGTADAWVEFGTPGNVDYILNPLAPAPTPAPASSSTPAGTTTTGRVILIHQRELDLNARIVEGGTARTSNIRLFAAVRTDGVIDTLEYELTTPGLPFGTIPAVAVAARATNSARIYYANLELPLPNASYRWRVRAVDTAGRAYGWREFGIEGNVDFIVDTTAVATPAPTPTPAPAPAPAPAPTPVTAVNLPPPVVTATARIEGPNVANGVITYASPMPPATGQIYPVKSFLIRNTSGASLNYRITSSQSWLFTSGSANQRTGTVAPGTTSNAILALTNILNIQPFVAGTYGATFSVVDTSTNATVASVNVILALGTGGTVATPAPAPAPAPAPIPAPAPPPATLPAPVTTPTARIEGPDVRTGVLTYASPMPPATGQIYPVKSFLIRNTSGAILNYRITSSQSWLFTSGSPNQRTGTVAPGTTSNAILALTNILNIQPFVAGTYGATLSVVDTSTNATVASVNVILTLGAGGTTPPTAPVVLYDVTPRSLSFTAPVGGTNPRGQAVTVTNSGTAALDWSATESAPWLSLQPAGGTIQPGQSIRFLAEVDVAGLAAGRQTTEISVRPTGSTQPAVTVGVTLDVNDLPRITLSDGSISFSMPAFGHNPSPHALKLRNTGKGTLDWKASEDAAWLQVTSDAGRLEPDQEATLEVRVTAVGLPPGSYATALTFSGPGATEEKVNVSLNISEAAGTGSGRSKGRCGLLGIEFLILGAAIRLGRGRRNQ